MREHLGRQHGKSPKLLCTEKRYPFIMLLVASLTIYVFQDYDFAAVTVTNVITEAAQEHSPMPPNSDPSCCNSSTDSCCHGSSTL